MPGWKGIVGTNFTPGEFDSYCQTLHWSSWRPSFIVLHNTAIPSLAQRPGGITKQHLQNFVSFYRDVQGWNSGPHLFVDDKQIWVFTPLVVPGTHSPSWNNMSLGVEMLGDYEHEAFDSGRGLLVRHNTVAAIASLSAVLGIDSQTMRLHREDPLTTHACPGKNVRKLDVIQEVQDMILSRHPGEHDIKSDPSPAASDTPAPTGTLAASGTPAPSAAPATDTPATQGTATAAVTPGASGTPAPPSTHPLL